MRVDRTTMFCRKLTFIVDPGGLRADMYIGHCYAICI